MQSSPIDKGDFEVHFTAGSVNFLFMMEALKAKKGTASNFHFETALFAGSEFIKALTDYELLPGFTLHSPKQMSCQANQIPSTF